MSGVYLIQSNDELVEFTEQGFESEDLLQDYLAKYPNLLAGDQINSDAPRRWLLISRELSLSSENAAERWSVDHLFLDQDAIPTIVEVKRSTDTRIRREVVGQMLDYAANGVVYWPIEKLQAAFDANCQKAGLDPAQVLEGFLGGQSEADKFWQEAKTNLQAGRVRLIFVSDTIPSELRRIVEFLNTQMDPAEVLAVEIKHYVGQGQRTLIPRLLGQTAEAQQKKGSMPREVRQWDEPLFFADLEARNGEAQTAIARKILNWAHTELPRLSWGKGKVDGSVVPILDYKGTPHWFFAIYTFGLVEFSFQFMKVKPPFSDETKRAELLRRLNEIPGVDLHCKMYQVYSAKLHHAALTQNAPRVLAQTTPGVLG
ncbi:MAG: hypothetical protein IT331_08140 [Anaerolineae bacterium]|nr:hypothetical protein [Anaerolineae bacterium]